MIKTILNSNDFTIDYNLDNEQIINIVNDLNNDKLKFNTLYELSFKDNLKEYDTTLKFLIKTTSYLINLISTNSTIELSRDSILIELTDNDIYNITNDMPFMVNEKYLTSSYFNNMLNQIIKVFSKQIKSYKGSVLEYFKSKDANINVASRIYFHLVENPKNNTDKAFCFIATYSKNKNNKLIHTPLSEALLEFKEKPKELITLLSSVTNVCEQSSFINNLMITGELFQPIYLTIDEASLFLNESIMYESYGIMTRIPKWYKNKTNNPKVSLEPNKKEKITISQLIDLNPILYIDDIKITTNELKQLLNSDKQLINHKGKWVNINKDNIQLILNSLDKLNNIKDMTLLELLKLESSPNNVLDIDNTINIEVTQSKWFTDFKKELTNPTIINDIPVSKHLNAKLRPYQQIGYNWLMTMLNYGFGSLLADDMGLGKTLQVISVLTSLYEKNSYKTLLVVPSSLMFNWLREFNKFSNLKPIIIHNQAGTKVKDITIDNGIYITTYKMVSKLKDHKFDLLIIDEAQAIKNINTTQSNIIRTINTTNRIALSGTPIENNIMELYSIFDFLNKGLLGTSKEFTKLNKEIVKDESYGKIRKLIKPFLLRRLKTDKSIINDLPDKLETNEYITLSKKQLILYNKEVENLKLILEQEEIPKGIVLNMILKFKQICNHPANFLNNDDYNFNDSGKYDTLKQIAESIRDNQEQMLVFTQFKEMCEPLNEFLKSIFNKEGLVLTGSTTAKNRDLMVTRFNSDEYIPYMVLSLKAGGTGLNLVKANHVVHFDRWWNPAVENQASDRAYRIGQNKQVNVYKFITKNTIEERIDDIINSKQALSDNILKSNDESWITKLSKHDLIDLFKYKDGE